jgi:hypothetical protein
MKKIKDFENYSIDTLGNVWNTSTNTLKKYHFDSSGRCMVDLYNNGIRKKALVHRLVGDAFIPNPNNKPQINHINGIHTDNRLENLEWVTDSENKYHAYKIGLITPRRFAVLQYSKSGEFLAEHKSILDAYKSTRVDRKSIKLNIENTFTHAGGFIWKRK